MASKSKKNKVKFKWTKELFLLIGCIAAVGIATIILSIPSKKEKAVSKVNDAIEAYNTENSTSYSTLDKDEYYFKEISYDKLLSQKSSSDFTYVWYGSLTNSDYLQYMSTINSKAEDYDISTVYLFYADYVEDAKEDEETDSKIYKDTINEMESKLNESKDPDQEDIDLESYPALLVYKDNKLIFNSQTGSDSDEYTWTIYINQAFGLSKLD